MGGHQTCRSRGALSLGGRIMSGGPAYQPGSIGPLTISLNELNAGSGARTILMVRRDLNRWLNPHMGALTWRTISLNELNAGSGARTIMVVKGLNARGGSLHFTTLSPAWAAGPGPACEAGLHRCLNAVGGGACNL